MLKQFSDLIRFSFLLLFLSFSLAFFPLITAASASSRSKKHLGLDLNIGVPFFACGQFQVLSFNYLTFGFGYGGLPLQYIIEQFIDMDTLQAPISLAEAGGRYSLKPFISVNMRSYHVFFRAFPWGGSFFLQGSLTGLSLRGFLYANVQDDVSGASINAVSASVTAITKYYGVSLGWQFMWDFGLYFDTGFGVGYLHNPQNNISLGGLAVSAGLFDENVAKLINEKKQEVVKQFNQTMDDLYKKIKIIPIVFFNIGYAF